MPAENVAETEQQHQEQQQMTLLALHADDQPIISGRIVNVRQFKSDGGWSKLRVSLAGNQRPADVVGCTFMETKPEVGDLVRVRGDWEDHPKWGRQFKAEVIIVEPAIRPDIWGLVRWIVERVPGVGQLSAEKVFSLAGDQLAEMIRDPDLLEMTGITRGQAEAITAAYTVFSGNRNAQTFLWLLGLGLPLKSAEGLIARHGVNARDKVLANPWALATEEDGISFATADTIAAAAGVNMQSQDRFRAAFRHALVTLSKKKGHCGVPSSELIATVVNLLGQPINVVKDHLIQAIVRNTDSSSGISFVKPDGCDPLVMTDAMANMEKGIAARVYEAHHARPPRIIVRDVDPELNPLQKQAVRMGSTQPLSILGGGAGRGKTRTIRALVQELLSYGIAPHRIGLSAPTGAASRRLAVMTQQLWLPKPSTLHRRLRYGPDKVSGRMGFRCNEHNPLDLDIMILDEAVMGDIGLLLGLFKAIDFNRTRLVLAGDPYQMKPVGAGAVMAALIESGRMPYTELLEPMRQQAESSLFRAIEAIRRGDVPVAEGDYSHFEVKDPAQIRQAVVGRYTDCLERNLRPEDIFVLAPMYRGEAGVDSLNKALAEVVNPRRITTRVLEAGLHSYAEGDRVIQLDNRYDPDPESDALDVFNGELGIVCEVYSRGNDGTPVGMWVDFGENRVLQYTRNDCSQLAPGLAKTVHKAQGDEAKETIQVFSPEHESMHTRSLCYTGTSRAKETLATIGPFKLVEKGVRRDDQLRHSHLANWVKSMLPELENTLGDALLPAP